MRINPESVEKFPHVFKTVSLELNCNFFSWNVASERAPFYGCSHIRLGFFLYTQRVFIEKVENAIAKRVVVAT